MKTKKYFTLGCTYLKKCIIYINIIFLTNKFNVKPTRVTIGAYYATRYMILLRNKIYDSRLSMLKEYKMHLH